MNQPEKKRKENLNRTLICKRVWGPGIEKIYVMYVK